jgi:hypothetical protein
MSDPHVIVGVHITDRVKNAVEVQKVFTEFGCNIKTRVGLHDVGEQFCGPSGLVVIEWYGDRAEADRFQAALKAVTGVGVQSMVFEH